MSTRPAQALRVARVVKWHGMLTNSVYADLMTRSAARRDTDLVAPAQRSSSCATFAVRIACSFVLAARRAATRGGDVRRHRRPARPAWDLPTSRRACTGHGLHHDGRLRRHRPESNAERFVAFIAMIAGTAYYSYVIGSERDRQPDRHGAAELSRENGSRVLLHEAQSAAATHAAQDHPGVQASLQRQDRARRQRHPRRARRRPEAGGRRVSLPQGREHELAVQRAAQGHAAQARLGAETRDRRAGRRYRDGGRGRHRHVHSASGRGGRGFGRRQPHDPRQRRRGASFGEVAAFGISLRRTATVRAIVDCELYRLGQEDMRASFRDVPAVYDAMREKVSNAARRQKDDAKKK